MKNYNASVLLDALFSFLMLSTLCITLLPILNISNNRLNDQHTDLELKRVLYNQLIKTTKLPQNTSLNQYVITKRDKKFAFKRRRLTKKYVINKKVKAFTMIEMMLAMLIMLTLVQLIPFLLKTILIFNTNITSIADIELEFFLRDMIKDYKETKKVTIVNKSNIKFQKDDTTYFYKLKNNKVIKEVNHSGNITMLYNVVTFNVTELNNNNFLIDIKLQDKGETIEKTLYL